MLIRILIFLAVTVFGLCTHAEAQSFELSPLTGPVVDQAEYKWYKLHQVFYRGAHQMDSLRIIPMPELKKYQLLWYMGGESESVVVEEAIISSAKVQVASRGNSLLLVWQRLVRMSPEEDVPLRLDLQGGGYVAGEWGGFWEGKLVLMVGQEEREFLQEDLQTITLLDEPLPTQTREPGLVLPANYLVGLSAMPMEQGLIYYQNTLLFVNSVGFYPTDNIQIRAGTDVYTLAFTLFSSGTLLTGYAQASVGFEVGDGVYVGGSVMGVGIMGEWDLYGVALGFGTLTLGNERQNASISMGWGMGNEGLLSPVPSLNVSGQVQMGSRTALVSENWLLSVDQGESLYWALGIGGKVFWEKVELTGALAIPGLFQGDTPFWSLIPLPYVSLAYRIN